MSPEAADLLVDKAADAARATVSLQLACHSDSEALDNDAVRGVVEWGIFAGILATLETLLAEGVLEEERDG